MVSIPKAASNGDASADIQAIMNDLASLRSDIATLTNHVSSTTVNAANSAAGQIGTQASKAFDNLSAQSQRSVKAIGNQIEEQPITSLLIAFALGFVGSRMLSR